MNSRIVVPPHLLHPISGDMSDYVVHFTHSAATLGKILGTGYLKPSGPYGFGHFRKIPDVASLHMSACLSEIPLDQLTRLTGRHGHFGVGFTKDFILQNHGARVWYLDQGSTQARTLRTLLDARVAAGDFADPIWELTPFIDYLMPSANFAYDWEREWRVRGGLDFGLTDVAFVVTPNGFDELPEFEGLYFHPKHELIIAASTQPLEEYVEDLIQTFFLTFEDPNNCLPWDGGYVWIVEPWDTADAVSDLFYDVHEEIQEELIGYLNGTSDQWVRSADLGAIYE